MIRVALDAMGGDFGPEVTVPAAFAALARHEELALSDGLPSTQPNE